MPAKGTKAHTQSNAWAAWVCLTNGQRCLLDCIFLQLSLSNKDDYWSHSSELDGLQAFIDSSPEQLQQVVSTNMVGTLLCTRAAMQVMQKQNGGGHIFNMDGAGADGMPTPQYAAYGATKAGRNLVLNFMSIT